MANQPQDIPDDSFLPTAEQYAELGRRLVSFEDDIRDGVTWQELKASLEKRKS